MKANWFIKFTAVLLAVWYMFAVTGFDIHRCSDNGRTYIEPLVAGISCNDIHPDTPCCHHNNMEKHCCGCQEDEDCCTDEIEVIILAGCNTGQDSAPVFSTSPVVLSLLNCYNQISKSISKCATSATVARFAGPPDKILRTNCILKA